MRKLRQNRLPFAAAIAMVLSSVAAQADNITMSVTYYTVAENDQDMNDLAIGIFSNEVQSKLGPDGLPVLNTAAYGCTAGCFINTPLPADLTAGGEITWWSPSLNKGGPGGISDVVETGTGTITLPYSDFNLYPPNGSGTNDAFGLQSAVYSTVLHVPSTESISFNVGADDVAFVYLDGSIVCDLGGVHPDSPGSCTSSTLSAGNHTLELFYADLHVFDAALTFDVTTSGVSGTPTVPEPASLALAGIALAGLAAIRRRLG